MVHASQSITCEEIEASRNQSLQRVLKLVRENAEQSLIQIRKRNANRANSRFNHADECL